MRVSYVGMVPQTVTIKQGVINVVLKSDAKALDEVVVTAMGISREKKALGYAVQDVKSEQLTQASNSSLAGALQGKVSGLDIKPSSGMPGASSQITIRGARSFSGDNTPLYVIDGMAVTSPPDVDTQIQNNGSVSGVDFANRAVDIDPNDIESINILKGQAASATPDDSNSSVINQTRITNNNFSVMFRRKLFHRRLLQLPLRNHYNIPQNIGNFSSLHNI